MEVNLAALPLPTPGVIFKTLPEGAVLFATTDEIYFGLNEVGARIWNALPPVNQSLDELCSTIANAYPDAPVDVIRADIVELLGELERLGLVTRRDPQRA